MMVAAEAESINQGGIQANASCPYLCRGQLPAEARMDKYTHSAVF